MLWYYATMLPFFVLAYPLKHFLFGFNWSSFVIVSPSLASLYVCLFPHIKKCIPFSLFSLVHEGKIKMDDIFPSVLKCVEIKPKKIMSLVPLLVQKRERCSVEECFCTLMLCVFIFIFGLLFSINPLFLISGSYYF